METLQKTGKRRVPGQSKINKDTIVNLPVNMINNIKQILNASLSSGHFPTKFKNAIVKYIPKSQKDTQLQTDFPPRNCG